MYETFHKGKKTLAAISISYNEERDLPGFIEHLLSWVDEIIIVDDGSTDNTKKNAENYGNRVRLINHKMAEKDFANQRNIGIDAATSDWLLHMDIDERVSPELAREMCNRIQDENYNGYRYRRLNFFLHRPMRGGSWQTWNHAQLARRGFHRFKNKIHEECKIQGKVGQLNSLMWHFNDTDYSERMRKSFQYSHMEAEKLIAENKKVKWFHFIIKPVMRFLKIYVYHKGFKDGTVGLLSAVHSMDAEFRAYALAWDTQNKISREEIEKEFAALWNQEKNNRI